MTGASATRSPATYDIGRQLHLFSLFRFLSTSYLFTPILVFFFQRRGLDFTEITLLNSVYALTAIVFEVPTGALADRFGRRRAMMMGALMMAAGCCIDYAGHHFWTFAVGESFLALGMTLTSGADSAYLYDLLQAAGLAHEYRRREGAATGAKLLGAALALAAGGLLARHSLALTYLVSAFVCAAAAVVAGLLREEVAAKAERRPLAQSMYVAARDVVTLPALRFAVGFSVLIFTLLRMGLYLQPTYLDQAGFGVGGVGLLLAVLSLAGALSASRIDSVRRALGEDALVWGLPLGLALSYLLLGRWFAPWGVALIALQAVVNGIYSPFSKELLNREIRDSRERATTLSVESMGRRLAFGAFAPVAGELMDRHGLPSGFYACAALGLGGGGVLFWLSQRRRKRGLGGFAGEVTPTPLPIPEPASAPEVEKTSATVEPATQQEQSLEAARLTATAR